MSTKKVESPRPNGRPTKYKPEYCEELIEYMAKGFSFEAFAGKIQTHKDTLYEWCKVHKDFSDAKSLGLSRALVFWEEIGIRGLWNEEGGPKLNTANYIFQLKNRFKWTDRVEVLGADDSESKPIVLKYNIPKNQ